MSERCTGCLVNDSKGSLGPLRYCYRCFSSLSGLRPKELRRRQRVDLRHGRRVIGEAEWIPDAARSRERAAKCRG